MSRKFLFVIFSATLFATGSAAGKEAMTVSLWLSSKHPVATAGYDPFVKMVKERYGSDFNVRYFQGGALQEAKATLGGLRNGVIQSAMLALTYYPAELPHAQLVADIALATRGNLATALAVTEFNLLHCADCLAEFERQNIVYTGTYSTTAYTLISNKPIRTPADLKGLKIRVPGSVWSRWARAAGAVEVNLPANDMFDGLSRGALDAAIQSPSALKTYSLWDAAKYVSDVNLGTYHSFVMIGFNKAFWGKLTDQQRQFMLDETARANVDVTLAIQAADITALAEGKQRNIQIVPADDSLKAAIADFALKDIAELAANAATTYRIADAPGKIGRLRKLIDKWNDLLGPAPSRERAITLSKTEIFAKLPAGYGK
jgi:TRAP-type C4-dicarboxylate transport system substrate-binding protein